MISCSFGSHAFNKGYYECTIDMVIGAKSKYQSADDFLSQAAGYLDKAVYPGDSIAEDYIGASLKAGNYTAIVKKWLSSMDEKVEINMDAISAIWRVKRADQDLCTDAFLIDTDEEYILLLWETTA